MSSQLHPAIFSCLMHAFEGVTYGDMHRKTDFLSAPNNVYIRADITHVRSWTICC